MCVNQRRFPLFCSRYCRFNAMKLMRTITGLLILTGFLNACTIEKRTYLPGYSVQWNAHRGSVTDRADVTDEHEKKPIAIVIRPDRILQNNSLRTPVVPGSVSVQVEREETPRLSSASVGAIAIIGRLEQLAATPRHPVMEKTKKAQTQQQLSGKGDNLEISLFFLIIGGILLVIGFLLLLLTTPIPAIIFFVLSAIFFIIPVYLLIANAG